MKKLLLLILSVSIIGQAVAQWSQLKNPDLSTCVYKGLVYTGSAVVAAGEGGIFRSTDNGLTWNISVTGIDTTRLEVNDITYIQSRGEIWITANKLYKSTNGGLSWVKVTPAGLAEGGWTENISRIGSKLVLTYGEWDNGLNIRKTWLCYSDNGTNWSYGQLLSADNSTNWRFLADDNDRAVYMIEEPGNDDENKLWYTENVTSKQLHPLTGLGSDPDIDDKNFSIGPQGNNFFYRSEKDAKFYIYNNSTSEWTERMNGIGGAGYTVASVFNIHSLGEHVLASVILSDASSNIFLKLYYSADTAKTWSEVTNPGVDFPVFEDQMIIAGSNRIIGEYFNASIAWSDDVGQTWHVVNTVFSGEFNNLTGLPNGHIFVATLDQQRGILKSEDNGNTWVEQNGDLPNFMGIYMIDGLFANGSTLYAVATEDPFTEKERLYKSDNEGLNWTKITNAPDSMVIMSAGRHGSWPIMFFADKSGNGTYHYTSDAGATWHNISAGIEPLGVDKVSGIRGNGTIMLLYAEKGGSTKVYLSENNGVSFSDRTLELGASNLQILIGNRWEWRILPSPIAGFKSDGTEFYTAVLDNSLPSWTVWFYKLNSTYNGWTRVGSTGLELPETMDFHSLRNISGVWYFTTPVGVFASINNCNSWQRVWNNEGFLKGVKPASVIVNNYGIFMGTFGTGIWRAPLNPPAITTSVVTSIQDVRATGGATVNSTGGLPFGNKGLCWATHSNPTISDNMVSAGASWAGFSSIMEPLTPVTPYYVKAFVQSPEGLVYGNEVTFTTTTTTGIEPEKTGKIVVFPNPVKEVLNISCDNDYSMNLLDITGRVVLSSQINPGTSSFLVDKLPTGLYILKTKDARGEVQVTRVIIK